VTIFGDFPVCFTVDSKGEAPYRAFSAICYQLTILNDDEEILRRLLALNLERANSSDG
jgi:hypothetical protein